MSILADYEIQELAEQGMLTPYEKNQVRKIGDKGILSYGTSSYGYDTRCAPEFKIFTNINSGIIDPKNFQESHFISIDEDYILLPPNSFALSRTIERFKMPNDVIAICMGKSTYARAGLLINVTPIEPGWEGHVVLELSNTTTLPMKIYANEGIAQFLFFRGNQCKVTYADRKGKYQNQSGITLPSV
jgi:dCTP deaminase